MPEKSKNKKNQRRRMAIHRQSLRKLFIQRRSNNTLLQKQTGISKTIHKQRPTKTTFSERIKNGTNQA